MTPAEFIANFETVAEAPGGIKKLREMVVALAMRGRLVPQDPKEAPAEVLLEKIMTERALLAKQGVLKGVGSPSVAGDLGDLPSSWKWTSLGSVIVFGPKNGYSPRAVERLTNVKSLTLSATTSGTFDGKHSKYIDEPIEPGSALWLRDGDILIQRGNTIDYVGVAAIYRGAAHEFIYPDLMMKVRVSDCLNLEYIHLALNSKTARQFIVARASGTSGSMPKINQSVVEAIPIAVPPAYEQQRIVKRVTDLMRLCDDLEARQTKKRETAVRLNRAALDALTTAEGPEEVAASFRRVAENFEALVYAPESVEELRRAIRGLACGGKLLSVQDADIAWATAQLNDLAESVVDCPHSTPAWTSSGIICLRTTNFRATGLDLREVRFVGRETYDLRVARLVPKAGDVVYSREGGILGIACVIPELGLVCMGQRMMLIRCKRDVCTPEWLTLVLNAPTILARVVELTGGTASPHLNVGDVRKFEIPVPPLAEQKRIVAKVEQLMALCDTLEAALRRAETTAQKLAEAVVAEIVA